MQRANKRLGFTLIEVALAIVVVGVGALAMYSLIGTGMDMSARAVADTQAALFAESVFNGMRAQAQSAAQNTNWHAFWTGGMPNLRVAATSVWVNVDSMKIKIDGASDVEPHPVEFVNVPIHSGNVSGIENFALKYVLYVPPDDAQNETDKPLRPATHRAFLSVWPGRYGKRGNPNDALRFYTEFPLTGSL